MKILISLFLALFLALTQLCQPCLAQDLRAVLLLESAAQDYGPLDDLRKAFTELQKHEGIRADIRVATTYPEQKKLFHEVASGPYHMVVVATPIFHTLLNNNAANYRRQNFVCLDADIMAPNIVSIIFADVQSAYLCGVAVGTLTANMPQKTQDPQFIGMIGDESLAQESMHKAFMRGVHQGQSTQPHQQNIEFLHTTLPNIRNSTAAEHEGRHAANELIQKKASVILCTLTGAVALGVQKASLEHDIYLVGMNQHLSENTPSAESFSLKKHMGKAVSQLVLHVWQHSFPVGQIQEKTVKDEHVGIITSYHNIKPSSAQAIERAIADSMKALREGRVVLEGPRGLCQCF